MKSLKWLGKQVQMLGVIYNMATPLLMLGFYSFMPLNNAFEKFERTRKFDWQAQKRLMRRPAMQFNAIGGDTISISGSWYNELTKDNEHIADKIAIQASLRLPLPVLRVSGKNAKFLGLWCITEIKQTHSNIDVTGTANKVVYNLKLENFGLDFGGWV